MCILNRVKWILRLTKADISDIIYIAKNELSFDLDYETSAEDLEEYDF